MNGTLVERLNRAKRRTDYLPGRSGTPEKVSFEGGSFTDYIREGNSCFYVREANPLEPFDVDTLYVISCK